jgi:hypothetical protein
MPFVLRLRIILRVQASLLFSMSFTHAVVDVDVEDEIHLCPRTLTRILLFVFILNSLL